MTDKRAKWVSRFTERHGEKYNYSKFTEYKDYYEKVTVICPHHGDFNILVSHHARGVGCSKCGTLSSAIKTRHTFESFVEIARAKHKDKYYYVSPEMFIGEHTRLDVLCPEHGYFNIVAGAHKQGNGCAKCSFEAMGKRMASTQEHFLTKARQVHGDKYDYSETLYIRSNASVSIRCKEHGVFNQKPNSHHKGHGCPSCSKNGFQLNASGWLYVMYSDSCTKVGITNKDIDIRRACISKLSGMEFKSFVGIYFEVGLFASLIETKVLRKLRLNYTNPDVKFGGSTECFTGLTPMDAVYVILKEKEGMQCPLM